MSGVLRRGSLNFDLDNRSKRGSIETNLYGGYCDTKTVKTPEISVISFDFRRHSADLKKDRVTDEVNAKRQQPIYPTKNPSDDPDSDIISDLIGHYGKWNFIWTFILSLFQIMPTFQMFAFVFQTADKDFWCARPQHLANVNETIWKNLTQTSDSCAIRDIDYAAMNSTESLLDSLLTPQTTWNFTQCEHFEFETNNNDQSMTLVQEFGLVCSNRQLLSVVEMCFLAGAAVGSVSSGWISDKFGRKHTLMAFALLQATFGTILAFSTSLGMYMTLRVIIGYASMTVTVVSFVLVVELVSGKWRVIVGILNILPVAVTYVITAGISYFIRDWRTLQLTITLPWFVILSIWYCVPESPRWLLAKGRLDELYGIVERAARLNGITLPANYRKALEAVVPPSSHNKTKTSINGTNCEEATSSVNNENVNKTEVDANASPLVVVFSKAYLRTTCLTLIVWLTLIIIYFGLTLHLSNLGGNIYVNTAIAGSVEAVSICLSVFVVLKLGIRVNLIAYMLIPGVCCLAVNIIPKGDENLIYVIALAMIAKCVIGANNAIIPTYTAMQYPTIVRNFGVGMGNLAAGVGLILVPYMWLLEHIDPLLPMSVMGVSGLIGAIALALMKDVRP